MSIAPPFAGPLLVTPAQAPPGALDERVSKTVNALRELVQTDLLSWSDGVRQEAVHLLDDFTLLRYLQARPEGLTQALNMFRESCEWRTARNVSALFAELHPAATCNSLRHRLARAHFYGGFGGIARDGTPYFVERVGQADLCGIGSEPAVQDLVMDACKT